MTKTFKEECYIQGLFDTVDDLDISFQEMKQRNFDPVAISHIAHKMLIQEMAPLGSLKKKIEQLDYGDNITVGDDDTLAHYDTICIDEIRDNEINSDISKILNVNCQKIIH